MCHESCKTCDNSGPQYCLECKDGLIPVESVTAPGHMTCDSCTAIHKGLFTSKTGKCQEICGDGINLGLVECDDGNNLNYDGCSSDCKVEYGFKCYKRKGLPDYCVDVFPPQGYLEVRGQNLLVVRFSETVTSVLDSETLSQKIGITLQGTREKCGIEWSLINTFPANSPLDELAIKTSVECTIRGTSEKFIVEFNQPENITDSFGNPLATPLVSAKAKKSIYVTDAQEKAIAGTGTVFSMTSFATFGIALGVTLLQSAAVDSFWAFINMLQLLAYVPIISCELPYNLEVFLTEYLSVSKVTFPFKLVPMLIPNPLDYLPSFMTYPLNERFSLCGYESLSFLYNFAEQLFTWILLLVVYVVLRILCCCFSEKQYVLICLLTQLLGLHLFINGGRIMSTTQLSEF